ncbi:hypothetical protein CkaCkLH20_12728 [Colletotrichum karsti]|uniref:Uncharacterized protein n=1 Tax=Colletotrichum karsti TaxID=1095194 RepID=A0A9P6HWY4_9PEZI|nr:uncharacterized protein CkaCkLH20_12728 [Colletotrichum karsti]KAF9869811.1 hypothetical protein CkaCkLH20_12728 [Colletotrichum karsti]
MSKNATLGHDPVPRQFWFLVGGNMLSPPPTWDRLVAMTEGRTKVVQDAKNEKREFQEAQRRAKQELAAAKKAYKDSYSGGLAAWKQRKRDAENASGDDGDGTGREE